MDLEISLTHQIDDIQRRLRECNFECNRLKEIVAQAIPDLLRSRRDADAELTSKTAEILALQTQLAELHGQEVPTIQDSSPVVPETVATAVEVPALSVETITATDGAGEETRTAEPTLTNTVAGTVPATAGRRDKTVSSPRSREGLEDFIGGNLLNKIGIGILIIGIGIFVKYAIDKDWIGAVGRVMVGLISGGILLGVAHWLRKAYKAFSSVLLGGGIAVLYFSVAIAFHQYALLSQTAAFVLMCGITATAVFFSIAYNRQEIAILALLGSFATPFMVAKGDGNWVALFTYILIVNAGMLVLAWFREWKLVRILGYALALLLFGGWLLREYALKDGQLPAGALVFGTLFFLTFFMTSLAYRIRKQQVADTFTYISLISNSVFYYGSSMLIIQQLAGGIYMGIFTAGMAVFHFSFILPLRKLLKVNDHVQTMLVGLVLSFVTLAIPIQLEGNYITLFWAVEAVLLLYMAQRTRISLLLWGSMLVSGLTVIVLGYHWADHYGQYSGGTSLFLLNGAYLTSFLTAAAMVALHFMHRRAPGMNGHSRNLSRVYQFLSLPLFYFGFLFELIRWLKTSGGSMAIGVSAFTAWYLAGMLVWALKSRQVVFGNVVAALGLVTLVTWSWVQASTLNGMRADFLLDLPYSAAFPWHFLAFAGMLALLGVGFAVLQRQTSLQGDMGKVLIWVTALLTLVVLSMELDQVLGLMGMDSHTTHKVGYPILWGMMGFVMIALGMREKLLALRIGGLALFLLILLKLFLWDIREVSPGGRIAAFISLGVLLLVVSFMYQRLRRLLSSQEDKATEEA